MIFCDERIAGYEIRIASRGKRVIAARPATCFKPMLSAPLAVPAVRGALIQARSLSFAALPEKVGSVSAHALACALDMRVERPNFVIGRWPSLTNL